MIRLCWVAQWRQLPCQRVSAPKKKGFHDKANKKLNFFFVYRKLCFCPWKPGLKLAHENDPPRGNVMPEDYAVKSRRYASERMYCTEAIVHYLGTVLRRSPITFLRQSKDLAEGSVKALGQEV